MIQYIFPHVIIDGQIAGTIFEAIDKHPELRGEIATAHDAAWVGWAGISGSTHLAELAAKDAEIAALKLKLAPAIHEITPQLLEAGLLQWGQDAVSAVDSDQGKAIMGMVMDLKMVAIEPPTWNQCQRIKQIFGAIMHLSKVQPTSEQATAMQAILDAGCPNTGPVPPEHLDFRRWISG